MPKIYVHANAKYDHSRWMTVFESREGWFVFDLTQLCQPGCPSAMTQVSLEPSVARSAIRNGAIQVSSPRGYFQLRRSAAMMNVEFKSHDEGSAVKVSLLCEDLAAALGAGSCAPKATLV